MFGEDISFTDLAALLKAIREKNLVAQVKIGEDEWRNLSGSTITKMTTAITSGNITTSNDIRLRLFAQT